VVKLQKKFGQSPENPNKGFRRDDPVRRDKRKRVEKKQGVRTDARE